MPHKTRKPLAAALTALATAALIAPPTSLAASSGQRLALTVHAKTTDNKTFTGDVTGTLGKGTAIGVRKAPKTTYTFRFARGTINAKSIGGTLKGTKLTSTFTITGGTKAFKNAKGSGKMSGDTATGVYSFTGKVSFG